MVVCDACYRAQTRAHYPNSGATLRPYPDRGAGLDPPAFKSPGACIGDLQA
jgi:hypothetical protein